MFYFASSKNLKKLFLHLQRVKNSAVWYVPKYKFLRSFGMGGAHTGILNKRAPS